MEISRNNFICSDFRMNVSGTDSKFEFWANLWHCSLGIIKKFFDGNKELLKSTKFLDDCGQNCKTAQIFEVSPINNQNVVNIEMRELTEDIIDSSRNIYTKGEGTEKIEKMHKIQESEINIRTTYIKASDEFKENDLFNVEEVNDYNIISKTFQKSNQKCNLNELIDKLNLVSEKNKIKPINKNDLNMFIKADELDKFHSLKKVPEEFGVLINYSLLEK